MGACFANCSVRFATAKSMEVAKGQATQGLKQAKPNSAFITKAPQGEWQTLIRVASTTNLRPLKTGESPSFQSQCFSIKMHS